MKMLYNKLKDCLADQCGEEKIMPQISAIVPVYKVEPYLHKCVDSILAQTFTDFELILVDDGSPDNCGRICDEYAEKDSRVKVIHQENGGVSSARNTGLAAATGEYIAFCDSDDFYFPNALEKLFLTAESTNSDYAIADFLEASSSNEEVVDRIEYNRECSVSTPEEKYYFIIDKLDGKHGQWAVWSSLYKKQIIDEYQIKFCLSCNNYAEDITFNINYILHCNKIAEIKDKLYCYNDIRDDSMMAISSGKYRFNDVNEAAYFLEQEYLSVFKNTEYENMFCAVHFMLMNCEYLKAIRNKRIKELPLLVAQVDKKEWLANSVRNIVEGKKKSKISLDKYTSMYIMTLARYIIDGNYLKYKTSFFLKRCFLKFRKIINLLKSKNE